MQLFIGENKYIIKEYHIIFKSSVYEFQTQIEINMLDDFNFNSIELETLLKQNNNHFHILLNNNNEIKQFTSYSFNTFSFDNLTNSLIFKLKK